MKAMKVLLIAAALLCPWTVAAQTVTNWSATTTYASGAMVYCPVGGACNVSAQGSSWSSLVNSNTGNDPFLTSGTDWQQVTAAGRVGPMGPSGIGTDPQCSTDSNGHLTCLTVAVGAAKLAPTGFGSAGTVTSTQVTSTIQYNPALNGFGYNKSNFADTTESGTPYRYWAYMSTLTTWNGSANAYQIHVVKQNLNTMAYVDYNTGKLQTSQDIHAGTAIGIDSNGYIHLAWGMISNALNYARSTNPYDPSAFGSNLSMLGTSLENSVTYPMFFNGPTGTLYFRYRTGIPSNAGEVMYIYNAGTTVWSAVPGSPTGSTAGMFLTGGGDTPTSSYYAQGPPKFDSSGNMWLVFSRFLGTPPYGAQNIYVLQYDGTTFKKADGSAQTIPATYANMTPWLTLAASAGAASQNDFTIDTQSTPNYLYVPYAANDANSIGQWYVAVSAVQTLTGSAVQLTHNSYGSIETANYGGWNEYIPLNLTAFTLNNGQVYVAGMSLMDQMRGVKVYQSTIGNRFSAFSSFYLTGEYNPNLSINIDYARAKNGILSFPFFSGTGYYPNTTAASGPMAVYWGNGNTQLGLAWILDWNPLNGIPQSKGVPADVFAQSLNAPVAYTNLVPQVPVVGQVLYWPGNEGGSTGKVLDYGEVGSGLTGTIHGTAGGDNGYYSGTRDPLHAHQVLFFDGTDNYVSVSTTLAKCTAFPCAGSVWLNWTNNSSYQGILADDLASASVCGIAAQLDSSGIFHLSFGDCGGTGSTHYDLFTASGSICGNGNPNPNLQGCYPDFRGNHMISWTIWGPNDFDVREDGFPMTGTYSGTATTIGYNATPLVVWGGGNIQGYPFFKGKMWGARLYSGNSLNWLDVDNLVVNGN